MFYELFNPQNARNVEQILHEFEGREAVLWRQLAHKYGSNAVQEAVFVRCPLGNSPGYHNGIEAGQRTPTTRAFISGEIGAEPSRYFQSASR